MLACGAESDAPRLDRALAGIWSGQSTVESVNPAAPPSFPSSLKIVLDDPRLNAAEAFVYGLCPDGLGMVRVIGEGKTAAWSGGPLTCIPTVPNCRRPGVTIAYSTLSLTLAADGMLHVTAAGTTTGCGGGPIDAMAYSFVSVSVVR